MERSTAKQLIGAAAGFGFGLPWAFFFVFQPLFTDGPMGPFSGERLVTYLITLGAYFVMNAVLYVYGPKRSVLGLPIPGLLLAAFYTDAAVAIRLWQAIAVASGSILGTLLAQKLIARFGKYSRTASLEDSSREE